jgi:hypothetical protein
LRLPPCLPAIDIISGFASKADTASRREMLSKLIRPELISEQAFEASWR